MKNRMISLALSLVLIAALLPTAAQAADDDFVILGDILVEYTGHGGAVVIPSGVTTIDSWAFKGCHDLTSVVIPNGVTAIDDYAFYECDNLTSVTIPDSVSEIGNCAFSDCRELPSVTIPDSVSEIGNYAFSNCWRLTSVTIPKGVTEIGDYAFGGCHNLTGVTIPDSLTEIGDGAFADTPWLESFGDFVVVNGNLLAYQGSDSTVTIPKGVTRIGGSTFFRYDSLISVIIPEGVIEIGDYAFNQCNHLTSVTIPSSVSTIGKFAFFETPWLRDFDEFAIVNGILFQYQGSGSTVIIPNGVTKIGDSAFASCDLTSVVIPEGVTEIDEEAFYSCDNLVSVTIPNTLKKIGRCAFQYCSSLTSLTIPEGLTEIGERAFEYCSSLTSLTIPEGVTEIGDFVFSKCNNLKRVMIPDSVIKMGEHIFNLCDNLTTVALPKSEKYLVSSSDRKLQNVIGLSVPEFYSYVSDNWKITACQDPNDCLKPQSDRIIQKSAEICAEFTDPYEKARAIFTWVAENIEYDYDYYEGRKGTVTTDPEGVLDCKLTICEGYSRLTEALLQAQGIPAKFISGAAVGPNGWGLHAWNAAFVDGRWIYLDATFGRQPVSDITGDEIHIEINPNCFDMGLFGLTFDHHGSIGTITSRTVRPNSARVLVNGIPVEFEAYTVDGNNYFKLRDLAKALNGSEKQFDVTWNGETSAIDLLNHMPYTPVGGELAQGDGTEKQATPNASSTYLDGRQFFLPAYTINENNFVKLRDLGSILDFNVTWDGDNQMILIDTSEPYTED